MWSQSKNRNKAFTLIELMAVVIILGIITTITVTSINYSIKKSRDRLYVQQIKRLKEGVRKWAVENTEALPFDETGIVFFSVSRLKDEGIVDTENVKDPRTNQELEGCMVIKYKPDFQQYSYEYDERDCGIAADAYMPLITVVGGDEQFIEVNGSYTFPIASAVDSNGRPLKVVGPIIYDSSDQIITSIDKSIVGTEYTLEYKSTDKLLNLTQIKNIKVTINDTIDPVITCDGRTTSYTVIHESSSSFSFPSCTVSDNSCGIGGVDTTVNSCNQTLTPVISTDLVATIPGTYAIEYTVQDSSNNDRVLIVSVNVTDTTAPTAPVAEYRINNSSGALYDSSWTSENIWIGNIASVEEGSGIEKYQYATGSSCATENPSWVDFPNGQDYLVVNTNENTEYCLAAVDYANNRSLKSSVKIIKIDKTAPTIPDYLAGTMRYSDPNFASGLNSMSVYNNAGGGTVTRTRISLSTPTGSGFGVRITTNGEARPGLGGFVQSTTSVANGVYAHVILARIPVGYTIQRAANSVGTGGTHTWITNQAGTGAWEEYIYITRAGSSGSFSSFGHVYLSGAAGTPSNPVTWDVASATIIDIGNWGREGSIVFRAQDSGGSNIVGYGINTSSMTQPTYTSVTNTSSIGLDIKGRTSNGTFYIWVKDGVGNVANRAVTLNRIDRTAPTCVSSGGSSTWTNGNRTITGTCSDSASGCSSSTVTRTYSTNTNTTTASPGTVTDNAGNTATCPANRTVRIDKTAPTCVSSGGSSSWTGGSRTITGTCSDSGGSGCSSSTVTRTYSTTTNTTTASPGTVTDTAGNTATCPANRTVRVDKTAPTCVSSGGSSTWTNGNRTITGTCSDSASGCSSSTVTRTYSTNTSTTTASPGTVTDNVGNTAVCPANRTIRIDKTAPTVSNVTNSSGGNWTNQSVGLGWTAADGGGSGFNQMQFSYNKSTINPTGIAQPTAGATSWTGSGTWTAARNNTIYFRITDRAGNVSAWTTGTSIRIDKTAPTITSVTNSSGGSWTNSSVTIGWTASDGGGSGFNQMQFSYNKSTVNPTSITQPTVGGTSWTGSAVWGAARSNYVYLRMTDRAGNVGSWTTGTRVRIDKTKPTKGNMTCGRWYVGTNSYRYYIFFGADAASGVRYIRFYAHGATRTIYASNKTYFTSTSALRSFTVSSRNVYDWAGNSYQPANEYISCTLLN